MVLFEGASFPEAFVLGSRSTNSSYRSARDCEEKIQRKQQSSGIASYGLTQAEFCRKEDGQLRTLSSEDTV